MLKELENLTQPSIEIDREVAYHIGFIPSGKLADSFVSHMKKHDYNTSWIAHKIWINDFGIPEYTKSLDSVLALTEELIPEYYVSLLNKHRDINACWASVANNDYVESGDNPILVESTGFNMATALLCCLIKILDSKSK